MSPDYSTWGNPENSFSNNNSSSQLIDYIFYRGQGNNHTARTKTFSMPLMSKTLRDGTTISLSDHQATAAEIEICASSSGMNEN